MVAMETKFGSIYCAISDCDILSSRTCRILSMVIKVVPFEGANKGLQNRVSEFWYFASKMFYEFLRLVHGNLLNWHLDKILHVLELKMSQSLIEAQRVLLGSPTTWYTVANRLWLETIFKTWFGFALPKRGLALGWPLSVKSLVNQTVQVRPRLK